MNKPARSILLEVCVDNVEGLSAAIAGGADRIELCAALEVGGLTPTSGLLRVAAASPLPVVAMIRPRGGDFCFDDVEIQLMLNEIDAVAAIGLQGVVLGASLRNGMLDQPTLERLTRRARDHGLETTLHRAIDLCPDLAQATRQAIDLGFARILTSGGAPRALEGIGGLQRCFDAAGDRITIMPGAGIGADNVGRLLDKLPVREVHASCSAPVAASTAPVMAFGFDTGGRRQTSMARVLALKAALNSE
nr:copper homeostasis protein CutC [uncultured Duganella sp.]